MNNESIVSISADAATLEFKEILADPAQRGKLLADFHRALQPGSPESNASPEVFREFLCGFMKDPDVVAVFDEMARDPDSVAAAIRADLERRRKLEETCERMLQGLYNHPREHRVETVMGLQITWAMTIPMMVFKCRAGGNIKELPAIEADCEFYDAKLSYFFENKLDFTDDEKACCRANRTKAMNYASTKTVEEVLQWHEKYPAEVRDDGGR